MTENEKFLLLFMIAIDIRDYIASSFIFNEKDLSMDYLYGDGFMKTIHFKSLRELKQIKKTITQIYQNKLKSPR